MRIASIDLGTNTFNLLIAEVNDGVFQELHREKSAVKLGKGGMSKKMIEPDAWMRGIEAIRHYTNVMDRMEVRHRIAVATSAVRTTANGPDFVQQLKNDFGLEVEVISGTREAELIWCGIRHAIPDYDRPVLMMDIGGGSNELLIADKKQIYWKKSYKLGIARLLEMFQPEDPIRPDQVDSVGWRIREELLELRTELRRFQVEVLAGSSGSFDTLANMVSHVREGKDSGKVCMDISLEEYNHFFQKILYSTQEERMRIPGMDPMRVEMMVLAVIFIDEVIKMSRVKKLMHSAYAIKEGIVFEYADLK